MKQKQHFGFPFNYRTLMLDYSKPTAPLPISCQELGKRMMKTYEEESVKVLQCNNNKINRNISYSGKHDESSYSSSSVCEGDYSLDNKKEEVVQQGQLLLPQPPMLLNQLTINEYLPGQGICSHIG